MLTSAEELRALQHVTELEAPLSAVEQGLAALSDALCRSDAQAIEHEASSLHVALAEAMAAFGRAARNGGAPPQLRQRLAMAGGQVAAQREALARATAALDRAIDVLLPGHAPPAAVYGANGAAARAAYGGGLQA